MTLLDEALPNVTQPNFCTGSTPPGTDQQFQCREAPSVTTPGNSVAGPPNSTPSNPAVLQRALLVALRHPATDARMA